MKMRHYVYINSIIYKSPSLIVVILLSTLLASCKKETQQWENINRIATNTSANFYSILQTGNNVIVVGGKQFETAEMFISHDGGNNWEYKLLSEAGKTMYDVCQSPDGTLYAIGYESKMLISKDNGYNWQFHQPNSWDNCKAICYPENETGFTVSDIAQRNGEIYQLDDRQLYSKASYSFGLNDINIVGKNGYAAGYGAVLKTTDGGSTWNYLDIKNDNFTAIDYKNKDNVWVCGSGGSVFHTTDGGSNWDKVRNGNSLTKKSYELRDIYFLNDTEGWCVGDKGVIIHTTDGGKKWKEYESQTTEDLRCIYLLADGKLLVCGDNGILLKLTRK